MMRSKRSRTWRHENAPRGDEHHVPKFSPEEEAAWEAEKCPRCQHFPEACCCKKEGVK